MSVAIKIENLSKQYRLGLVSTRTLSHDLNRWWQTSILGREDPYLKIGQENKLTTYNSQLTTHNSPEYVWALRNINLEIQEGEVLGIIGKNGAGKSTLLKILSKVTAPTTGIVKARGHIASLLEVGTGFHPEMTGRENIFMNGAIMGMTKDEIRKKFDEIVDFAGVERYIDTPVKRYSSGMTVRLGFAIAAHLEPEILVVDEVLAVGDAEFQKKAIGKMQDVSTRQGRTVLFVSHNITSIKNLCTRAIVLNNGEISTSGNVGKCIDFYRESLEGQAVSDKWSRSSPKIDGMYFTKANCILLDRKIRIYTETESNFEHKPAFIAFDFQNSLGNTLFQTIPNYEPFIKYSNKTQYLEIDVEIPLLIPDTYFISLWIGSHFNETFDWQQNVLKFEIIENPVKERMMPYSLNHGNIVGISKVIHYGGKNN